MKGGRKINLSELISSLPKIEDNLGGGTASALAGAMSANIINLVARLSIGRNYGYEDKKYEGIMKEASELEEGLKGGAIEDDKAYGRIASAYKLPKNSEKEIDARKKAISDGAYYASKVPCENAIKCDRVYKLAKYLENNSNPNTYTDLQCAINLAKLGIEGCIMNIEVNFSLIREEDKIKELKDTISSLR